MNSIQVTFNKNMIEENKKQISKLENELKNPKIRNIKQREDAIKNLNNQISQCLKFLFDAGVVSV